jgi:hypothetical protein
VLWRKSLRRDFGGQPGTWAYAESPLIDGEVLVATPGGARATLVALDKKTGDVIWQSAVPGGEPAGYASASVIEAAGRKQYVQFLDKGVVGVDAKTGRFLWRWTNRRRPQTSPCPSVAATTLQHQCAPLRRRAGAPVSPAWIPPGKSTERDVPNTLRLCLLGGDLRTNQVP